MVSARTWAAAVSLLLVSGCSIDSAAAPQPPSEPALPQADYQGRMWLEPDHGLPGETVSVFAEGLPASSEFDLIWAGAEGRWIIEGEMGEEYHGREYIPTTSVLRSVRTDAAGELESSFVVPEDFGFGHDVSLVDPEGVIRNKALFTLDMEVTVSPTEGPPGTPITIEVRGMGWQTLENNRTVLYDNAYTGWMSSVTTKGTARAVIPATGRLGPHRIQVARGAYTFPYLNPQQSPRPDIPVFEATFTVTEGDPVLPPPVEEQNPPPVLRQSGIPDGTGPSLTTDYESGPVGTPLVVTGGGFDPGTAVVLQWYRIVGNRVSGQGWDEQAIELGVVPADPDGSVVFEADVPADVGGPHRIEARVAGQVLADTSFSVTPTADPISPSSGPWGTEITIHLTGVGWTETANIYTVVYDNTYVGYACGFNSQGDVVITLPATGDPGWHFIDLYPAIYKGKETPGQQSFRIPQLTSAEDHPGEDLPAFRFAFYLEG